MLKLYNAMIISLFALPILSLIILILVSEQNRKNGGLCFGDPVEVSDEWLEQKAYQKVAGVRVPIDQTYIDLLKANNDIAILINEDAYINSIDLTNSDKHVTTLERVKAASDGKTDSIISVHQYVLMKCGKLKRHFGLSIDREYEPAKWAYYDCKLKDVKRACTGIVK